MQQWMVFMESLLCVQSVSKLAMEYLTYFLQFLYNCLIYSHFTDGEMKYTVLT